MNGRMEFPQSHFSSPAGGCRAGAGQGGLRGNEGPAKRLCLLRCPTMSPRTRPLQIIRFCPRSPGLARSRSSAWLFLHGARSQEALAPVDEPHLPGAGSPDGGIYPAMWGAGRRRRKMAGTVDSRAILASARRLTDPFS